MDRLLDLTLLLRSTIQLRSFVASATARKSGNHAKYRTCSRRSNEPRESKSSFYLVKSSRSYKLNVSVSL